MSILFFFFFLSFFLSSFPSSITQKVYSVYLWSRHQTNALLSEIFFGVRGACELHVRLIDELWPQTRIAVAFPYAILCVITRTNRSYKDVIPIELLLYYRRYLFSWLELYVSYYLRVMDQNTHCNHFLVRHFVCTYTHNSKTTGRMRTFYMYILNDCSTTRDV